MGAHQDSEIKKILGDRTKEVQFFGFKPDAAGIYGFCSGCYRHFKMKDILEKVEGAKTECWTGMCPSCQSAFGMMVRDITISEYEAKVKKDIVAEADPAARLKMARSGVIGGRHEARSGLNLQKLAEAAKGDVERDEVDEVAGIIKVSKTKVAAALKRLFRLRSYYRNVMRNYFASVTPDFMDKMGIDQAYMEYESMYYEGAVNCCIRQVLTTAIDEIWWKSLDEVVEWMKRDEAKQAELIRLTKRMAVVLVAYERMNWEKFFGVIVTTKVMNHEELEAPKLEYPWRDMAQWMRANATNVKDFKNTLMARERETDEFLGYEVKAEDDIEVTDEFVTGESQCDGAEVTEETNEPEKQLDELEYGVDEIPDV